MNLDIAAVCAGSRRHHTGKLGYTAQDPLMSEKKTAIAAAAAAAGGGGGGGGGNGNQALVAAIRNKNKVRGGYKGAEGSCLFTPLKATVISWVVRRMSLHFMMGHSKVRNRPSTSRCTEQRDGAEHGLFSAFLVGRIVLTGFSCSNVALRPWWWEDQQMSHSDSH